MEYLKISRYKKICFTPKLFILFISPVCFLIMNCAWYQAPKIIRWSLPKQCIDHNRGTENTLMYSPRNTNSNLEPHYPETNTNPLVICPKPPHCNARINSEQSFAMRKIENVYWYDVLPICLAYDTMSASSQGRKDTKKTI